MNSKDNLKQALKLYLVTDQLACLNRPLLGLVEEALKGGVTLVQYREKLKSMEAQIEEAKAMQHLCQAYNVPFIINDSIELASLLNASGAHVGQSDLDAGRAREILTNEAWLGVSVSTVEEALIAESKGADYLGVGAMFPTATKTDADAVSLETLTQICQAVKIPVVAIGGISTQNINQLKLTGIDGVAVVSAVLSQVSAREAAESLQAILTKEFNL